MKRRHMRHKQSTSSMSQTSALCGLSAPEVVVCLGVLGVVIALKAPSIQHSRESALACL